MTRWRIGFETIESRSTLSRVVPPGIYQKRQEWHLGYERVQRDRQRTRGGSGSSLEGDFEEKCDEKEELIFVKCDPKRMQDLEVNPQALFLRPRNEPDEKMTV